MAGDKIEVTFQIDKDRVQLLEKIRDQYQLPDTSKVVRVVLDFLASDDAEWAVIFGKVRCNRC